MPMSSPMSDREVTAEAEEENEKEGVRERTWNELTKVPILYSLTSLWEDTEKLAGKLSSWKRDECGKAFEDFFLFLFILLYLLASNYLN